MWPFYLERSVSASKRIRASVSQAHESLLNVDAFVKLSPYVTRIDQDPSNPQLYKVTERLPGFANLWEYDNIFDVLFSPTDDERGRGVDVEVRVPQTFVLPKIGTKYRVRETDEPGVVEITEVVELRAMTRQRESAMTHKLWAGVRGGQDKEVDDEANIIDGITSRLSVLILAFGQITSRCNVLYAITGTLKPRFHPYFETHLIVAHDYLEFLYYYISRIQTYRIYARQRCRFSGSVANHLVARCIESEATQIHFLKHAEVELTAAAFSDISPLLTALAIKLCQAAKLEGGENILDVGHGTGESLVMFLTDEALPRPSQLTGITSLPSQCNRARNRISQIQRSKDVARNTQVDIYCGDAVCQDTTSPAHPLHSLNAAKFDVIYVLDCAYHFATRRQFLAQAFRKLTPGGRIVLADICYSADGVPTTATKFLTTQIMGFMPGENMVSKKQYVRELEEIGYQDVVLEDITEEAFRGTWEFLASKGELWSFLEAARSSALNVDVILPFTMTAIQAVFIRGYEERTAPKAHIVYRIEIQAHVRSWNMWRRYSEFDDLNITFTKSIGAPPCSLPPKHKFSMLRSHNNTKVLEERKEGLERYLRAIVSAKDDKWREHFAFREFLGIPIGRQGSTSQNISPTQFTSSSWLDEHLDIQARLRDVWADINKRDALSQSGDVAASHKSNVTAKTKLAGLLSRIGTLGKGLEELALAGMNEGELQRRTDMVARLQDDCEKLSKVVTVARQTSAAARAATSGGASALNPAPESDREALLGAKALNKPARRVFGASEPQETEITRPLDNVGLLGLQQVQMQKQDQQLAGLTTILQRQRHLGEAINHEIQEHIEILDAVSNDVDHVSNKLRRTNRELNRLG
ncbi:hypothetical protein NP233_g5959 [Leucocoprinus birnbaumii]|uniref:phosphoethanolamine N-methyltransferase n=1 Tax=Leucocoprinus birnbaumii TaxID=56174 RepID=A0AAD5VU77_9AGAR|nr:hypothetical protein NP233_g5959 [Leucocoprinus birnbaumii]